jgi:hypothetical protein
VVSNITSGPAESGSGPVAHNAAEAATKYKAAVVKLAALEAERARTKNQGARDELTDKLDDARQEAQALSIAARGSALIASTKDGQPRIVHLNTGWSWFDNGVAHMSANPELTLYKLKTYGYKYSWALIPISLPFMWLLFAFRRDVGLYDHAIFSIYSLSFMSLGVVVLTLLGWAGVPSALVTLAVIFVPPIHMYRQLKGAYGLGRFGATWRTFGLLVVTSITSSIFLSFLFWMGSE